MLLSKLVSEHALLLCSETILETTLQKHSIPQTSELQTTSGAFLGATSINKIGEVRLSDEIGGGGV